MRNLYILVLIACTTNIFGQNEKLISKGNKIIGGNISGIYISGKTNESYYYANNNNVQNYDVKNSQWNLGLSPIFGYFVADRFVVGIKPSYSYSNLKSSNLDFTNSTGNSKNNNLSIGLFSKYYLHSGILFSLDLLYGNNKSNSYSNGNSVYFDANGASHISGSYIYSTTSKSNSININPGVGYAWFLKPNVSIEMLVLYNYQRQFNGKNVSYNYILLSNGSQTNTQFNDYKGKNNGLKLNIGLNYFF